MEARRNDEQPERDDRVAACEHGALDRRVRHRLLVMEARLAEHRDASCDVQGGDGDERQPPQRVAPQQVARRDAVEQPVRRGQQKQQRRGRLLAAQPDRPRQRSEHQPADAVAVAEAQVALQRQEQPQRGQQIGAPHDRAQDLGVRRVGREQSARRERRPPAPANAARHRQQSEHHERVQQAVHGVMQPARLPARHLVLGDEPQRCQRAPVRGGRQPFVRGPVGARDRRGVVVLLDDRVALDDAQVIEHVVVQNRRGVEHEDQQGQQERERPLVPREQRWLSPHSGFTSGRHQGSCFAVPV